MTYTQATALDAFSYNPSSFEVKAFNALEKGYNSVKNGIKNAFNYISTIAHPENTGNIKLTIIDKYLYVYDNINSMNTRGHYIQLTEKVKELFTSPEANEFRQYLKSKGKIIAKIDAYSARNLAGRKTIAGVKQTGLDAIPFIGPDYYPKIAEQARKIGTSMKAQEVYTALHEIGHTIISPKNIFSSLIYKKYPYTAETFTEKTVLKYALKKIEQATTKEEKEFWSEILEIAKYRLENVKDIYSKRKKEWKKGDKKENLEEKVKDEEVESKENKQYEKSKEKYSKEEKEYEGKEEENIEENQEEANPKDNSENLESMVEEGSGEECSEACEGEASE